MILADNETRVDLLNNEAIATTIVKLLRERAQPVTVGVHGDWGAGKSSILEMIDAGLAEDDTVLCLKFNGWRFQGFEDAKIALIEGIVTGLIEKRPFVAKTGEFVKDLFKRIDWLKAAKHAGGLAFTAFTGIPTLDQIQAMAVKQRLVDIMADKSTPAWLYNDIKREHLIRTGSVVYHEYYFDNLGGNGQPGAAVRTALGNAFGTYDAWENEFRQIAGGLGGGSGWVMLGFNAHTQQLENYWMGDHAHGPPATLPLLVLDMYEHSYQMDFGAATARYIDAFFVNIQWDAVQSRLEQARKVA